jgi:hypothetical protein
MHPRRSSETPLQFPGSTPPQDLKTTTIITGRRIAILPAPAWHTASVYSEKNYDSCAACVYVSLRTITCPNLSCKICFWGAHGEKMTVPGPAICLP